jgi:N-hydroxyarylamine O-acetyltransferase
MPQIDLDAYFRRIGWAEPVPPDLATLSRLLQAHMRAIPFENLDVLMGRPIRLDLASLQQKLIAERRGGYCFEHATLFAALLAALGLEPACHLARVLLHGPKERAAQSHMFVTLALPEGRYVFDPGFGGPASRLPVRLAEGENQASHWFQREGGDWVLRMRGEEGTRQLWGSTLAAAYPIDFEVASHYVATHPDSAFVTSLMMSRFTEEGSVSLRNRDATLRRGEAVQRWQLADRAALQSFLAEHFDIALTEQAILRLPAFPEGEERVTA